MIKKVIGSTVGNVRKNVKDGRVSEILGRWFEQVSGAAKVVLSNDLAKVGTVLLAIFVFMALFGPTIAPHDPDQRVKNEAGEWQKNLPPSLEYPLGTTSGAYPLFTQILLGARVAFLIGVSVGVSVAGIGTMVGIVSGYYGGHVENALMRVVDLLYGIPFLPFAIVVVFIFGNSLFMIVSAMVLLFWKTTARVIRSEVVSIREQEMIDAARAAGASDRRIILFHILPVVFPITLLYSVFAIGWAILAEAGLAFLGLGSPEDLYSWGTILNGAHANNALQNDLWLWIFTPGLCLVVFVMMAYFIGQGLEELSNPELREM